MALRFVVVGLLAATTAAVRVTPANVSSAPPVAQAFLAGQRQLMNTSFQLADAPACKCQASDPLWKRPTRTTPKCIFIDLGAANGNTLNDFLADKYGPVKDCGHSTGAYEAFLVEANPRFAKDLQAEEAKHTGTVHAFPPSAAYMCEGQTSFYLDTTNHDVNYWGSSMSSNHPDAVKSGLQKVTVPTVNVLKVLTENTIPDDYVILKMDIEGAEWDIMPCLAESPIAHQIDRFFLEQHPAAWSAQKPSPAESTMADHKAKLASKGVDMPGYFSNTLF